jgi:hypothetical protein
MKRIIINFIICLALMGFYPLSINAADELLGCDPGVTVMDIGDIIECDINPISDSDIFDFHGIDGEELRLTLTDRTGFSPTPCLELFDPDNQLIDNWLAQDTGVSHQIALVKTGTYRIFVRECGDNSTVVYRIALQRKFPPPPEALTLLYDEILESITINPVPDSDVFLFNGAIDDTIRLTLTDRTGFSPAPCLELFDPDDQLIDNWCAQDTGEFREFVLLKNGTYTILVYESGDNSDVTYNLALQCLFGSCSPPSPIPQCGGQDATIIGTEDDNVIIGTDGEDVIVGLGGNDIIYGLDGKDRICGGDGDDTIYGGLSVDRLWGDVGNDVLRGEGGRDILIGGGGNDTMDGGGGNDTLKGRSGNDTLFGAVGDDELIGNDGLDVCDGGNHTMGDTADDTCEAMVNVEF